MGKRPQFQRWTPEEDQALESFRVAHPTPDDRVRVAKDFVATKATPRRTLGAVHSRLVAMRDKRNLASLAVRETVVSGDAPPPIVVPPPPADEGWRKVLTPKKWNAGAGEILDGVYLGPRQAEGQYGPYVKHLIAPDRGKGALYVSGTVADQLFTVSMAQAGARVRVVYLGKRETVNGEYNDFELYVKEPT
jgi:hypothetical protein